MRMFPVDGEVTAEPPASLTPSLVTDVFKFSVTISADASPTNWPRICAVIKLSTTPLIFLNASLSAPNLLLSPPTATIPPPRLGVIKLLTLSPKLTAVVLSTPPFSSRPSLTLPIISLAMSFALSSSSSTLLTRAWIPLACCAAASGLASCIVDTVASVLSIFFLCSTNCFCCSSLLSQVLPKYPKSQVQDTLQDVPSTQADLSIFFKFKSYAKQLPRLEQSFAHFFGGRVQSPSLQRPVEQSPLIEQIFPFPQGPQKLPPQSTSVSPPSSSTLPFSHCAGGTKHLSALFSSLLA
mmetsp:Transcript_6284/g.11417  ORF Transcript_6284/g.11417 Transcript_6284/m.11417 type:complete len:295 (+) Transcript_6284:2284-3168(+)